MADTGYENLTQALSLRNAVFTPRGTDNIAPSQE